MIYISILLRTWKELTFCRSRIGRAWRLIWFPLLAIAGAVKADDFTYTTNEVTDTIIITGYTGSGGEVMIPSNLVGKTVASIGDAAFYACTSLTSVTIPNSVISIGIGAFDVCDSLTNVTIGNGVTNIGEWAFAWCTSLPAITMNASNSAYCSMAGVLFNKNQTTLIQYPGGKTGSEYTITNSVTSIGPGAFIDCTNLTSITIPDSVTSIGESAFSFCTSLASVTVPEGVADIGVNAFYSCTTLTGISVNASNSVYISMAGVLFNKEQTTLIQYPGGKTGSEYTITNCVISIGSGAFSGCTSLANVSIPDSVTSIGDYAFESCANLTGVYAKGNAPSFGSDVFSDATNVTVYFLPGTTGWETPFYGRPTVLWNPRVQSDANFGVLTNQFGFNIFATNNLVVVVDACTNLINSIWSPVGTNNLSSYTSYFSDSQWTNYPARFYRLRMP